MNDDLSLDGNAAVDGAQILAVERIGVRLGGREVLRDVTFAIGPGEFTGLIGSNGAGKTTLFRVILGLQAVGSGSVLVAGKPRARRNPLIGYVPQKFLLDPDVPLRARDLVGLGLDAHRFGVSLPSRARRFRIEEMLEAVDARAFADQRVGSLSGGEQQRVLIAHALIAQPRLLLLDEPLANLDLRSGHEVVGLLARIAGEQQIAILISAHDMNPLLGVMDRVVYLAAGRAASGTVDEVVRTPVLSELYGHHVDVLRVHGRVLVVAGEAGELAGTSDPAHTHTQVEIRVSPSLAAIFAPGLFTSSIVQIAATVCAVVAVVAGAVGVFTVIRGQSFAGEALGDIGTTGGSGAYLITVGPLWGFAAAAVAAAAVMELIGIQRPRGRDVATGIVLGAGLGLAALFLYLESVDRATTGATFTIVFGSPFLITASAIPLVVALSATALGLIVILFRPLLLSSVSPELAAARGIPVRLIGAGYLLALAIAVALAALTIGTILSTALLVGPAATALRLTRSPAKAVVAAALIGIATTWLGIVMAYDSYDWPPVGTGWPVSFFVVTLIFLAYLLAGLPNRRRRRANVTPIDAPARA